MPGDIHGVLHADYEAIRDMRLSAENAPGRGWRQNISITVS